eukprot:scaffold21484_cov55-Attheya_sp.AAC.2
MDKITEKPKLKISTKANADAKIAEAEQFGMEFRADYDQWCKRICMYEDNCTKSYALIWERCAKALQNKLQSRSDFDSTENDPIELLKAVKEHSLNYQENRYEMSIILDSIKAMIDTHQKEHETLRNFTKRFKTSRDMLESHIGGPIVLTKFVEQEMADYDALEDADKCSRIAYAQMLSLLYLENSDQKKYGSLLKGLNAKQSLGNNQYPTRITKASKVLTEHPFDSAGKTDYSKVKDKNKYRGKYDDKNNRKEDDPVPLSFAQMEGKCYCCGKQGHRSNNCRDNGKPKPEWSINRAKIDGGDSHSQVKSVKTEGVTENNNVSTKSDLTSEEFIFDSRKPRENGWLGRSSY